MPCNDMRQSPCQDRGRAEISGRIEKSVSTARARCQDADGPLSPSGLDGQRWRGHEIPSPAPLRPDDQPLRPDLRRARRQRRGRLGNLCARSVGLAEDREELATIAAARRREPLRGHARLIANPLALVRAATRWYVFRRAHWVGARPRDDGRPFMRAEGRAVRSIRPRARVPAAAMARHPMLSTTENGLSVA